MRQLSVVLIWAMAATMISGQTPPAIKTGPEIGTAIPEFALRDQNGAMVTSKSTLGAKGGLLVFYRSADW